MLWLTLFLHASGAIAPSRCAAWGELLLLGANAKLIAQGADVTEKSAPCERYLKAIALSQTDDPIVRETARGLFSTVKSASSGQALADWANLRVAELEWRTGATQRSARPPIVD